MRLAILGAGALARALVASLPARGRLRVTVAARRRAQARRVARIRAGTVAARSFDDALVGAEVVLLAVDDRAIEPLARAIAPRRPSWRGVVVLHAAGGLGTEPLRSLARRGADAGILHPVLPLSGRGETLLTGAYARISGTSRARAAASRLARAAGLAPLPRSRPERRRDRALHHAGASLATNDVVALLALAEDALAASGVARGAARRAVVAAASATVGRIRTGGPRAALSGPVVRGDAARLLLHLAALAAVHPAAPSAHAALSLRLVDLALRAGRLDLPAARALAKALAPRDHGRARVRTV